MTPLRAFLGGVALLALTVSTPEAQDLTKAAPGTKVTGVAMLGDKQIPLPEGEWELVFAETDKLWTVGGIPISSANAFLVRNTDGTAKGYILARTNVEDASTGWRRPRLCDRDNVLHNDSDSNYNKEDADCWIINHIPFGRRKARWDFFDKVRKYVRDTAGTSMLIVNWYWRNDASDYLRIAHYANPAAYGFARERPRRWAESDWHSDMIDESPRRKKFVEDAKAFGASYRDAVRSGFRNRLGNGVAGVRFEFSG